MLSYAIVGAVLGSFTGCMVDRILRKEDFLKGRSYCEHCHKTLRWYDLIPVISYLLLGGRCRYCHQPIKKSTLYVEIYGICLAMLCYGRPLYLIQAFILTAISMIDDKTMWIPDALNGIFFLSCLWKTHHLWESIFLPLVLYLVNRLWFEIIGEGDLILLVSMGIVLGYSKQVLLLLISSGLALCYSKINKIPLTTYQPFAPFLSIGYFLLLFLK